MKLIEFKNISKKYDKRAIAGVSDINFSISSGEIVSLIGPSGAGKTTTLNLLSEIIKPDSGSITKNSKCEIAYVAQNTHLDENKTVFEVLEAVLMHIDDEEKRINQVRSVIQTLELTNEIHHKVHQISGGQRQRVIVGRALVLNPNLIVLDEPFEHLDQALRISLIDELVEIFKDKKISILWVTHEIKEALSYSDKIIVLNFGSIQQIGTPREIYFEPQNLFVANFFTNTTTVVGKLISEGENELIINAFQKEFIVPKPRRFKASKDKDILLVIRPESFIIKEESIDADFTGVIQSSKFMGAYYLLKVASKEFNLFTIAVNSEEVYREKQQIHFNIIPKRIYTLGEI